MSVIIVHQEFLKLHKRSNFDGITYPCDQCDYLAVCVAILVTSILLLWVSDTNVTNVIFNGATHAFIETPLEKVFTREYAICDRCNYSAHNKVI